MGLFKLRRSKMPKGTHPVSNVEALESTSSFGSISCTAPPRPRESIEAERRFLGTGLASYHMSSAAASTSMLSVPPQRPARPEFTRRPSLGSNDMPPAPVPSSPYYNKFATTSAVSLRRESPGRNHGPMPPMPPLPPVPQVAHATPSRSHPAAAAIGGGHGGALGSNPQASASRISLANVRSASRAGLGRIPSLWRKKQKRQSSTDSDQSEASSDTSTSPRRWRL